MKYTSKFSGEEIDSILDNVRNKQDTINDLDTIRSNAQNASDTIASMIESGYLFAGIATIDTNPGIPDAKVFYIANGKGTYTNFGGLEVTEDDVVVLYYDTEWHKVSTGIASQAKLSELGMRVNNKIINSNFESVSGWKAYNGTIVTTNNELQYTVVTKALNSRINYLNKIADFVSGHKYYAFFEVESPKATSIRAYVGNVGGDWLNIEANTPTRYATIVTPTLNSELGFYVQTSLLEIGDVVKYKYVGLIDLTDIFGLGKECELTELERILFEYGNKGWFESIDFNPLLTRYSNNKLGQQSYFVVAANNSVNKDIAHFICDGNNDQEEINKAISLLPSNGGTIELLDGTYVINMPIYPKEKTRIVGKGRGTILKVADKVEAYLTQMAMADGKTIGCDVTGFQVGMDITIFDDDHQGYNMGDSRTIVKITPSTNTITVDVPLTNTYKVDKHARVFSAYNCIDCYGVSNVTIESIEIDGNKANNNDGNYDEWQNGVYLADSNCCVVKDCYIHDFPMAGVLGSHILNGTDGSEGCVVVNNIIRDCNKNAIHFHGLRKSVVSNNIVRGGLTQSAIYFIASDDNSIVGNVIESCELHGYFITGSKRNSLIGGSVSNCIGNGIRIAQSSGGMTNEGNIIQGVTITNIQDDGIWCNNGKHLVIKGNYIANTIGYGVRLQNSTYSVVSDNTLDSCRGTNSIIGLNGSFNSLTGNIVHRETSGIPINNTGNNCAIIGNVIDSISSVKVNNTGTDCIVNNNL